MHHALSSQRGGDVALHGADAGRGGVAGLRVVQQRLGQSRRELLVVELLALALNAPRFDDDAVARVKGQVISGLQRQAQNPETLCRNALYAAAFPCC